MSPKKYLISSIVCELSSVPERVITHVVLTPNLGEEMSLKEVVVKSFASSPMSVLECMRAIAMVLPDDHPLSHHCQQRFESLLFSPPELSRMHVSLFLEAVQDYKAEFDGMSEEQLEATPEADTDVLDVVVRILDTYSDGLRAKREKLNGQTHPATPQTVSTPFITVEDAIADIADLNRKYGEYVKQARAATHTPQPVEMEKAAEDIFPPSPVSLEDTLEQWAKAASEAELATYGLQRIQQESDVSQAPFDPLKGTMIETFRDTMLSEDIEVEMRVAGWYVNYGGLLGYYCEVLGGIVELDEDEEHEATAKQLKREATEVAETLDIQKAYAAFLMGAFVMEEVIRIEGDHSR